MASAARIPGLASAAGEARHENRNANLLKRMFAPLLTLRIIAARVSEKRAKRIVLDRQAALAL
jgi:hypothetical protein